jgi:hypothetical protein
MRGSNDAPAKDLVVADPYDGVGSRHHTPRLRSAAMCAATRGGWHPRHQQSGQIIGESDRRRQLREGVESAQGRCVSLGRGFRVPVPFQRHCWAWPKLDTCGMKKSFVEERNAAWQKTEHIPSF